MNRREVHYHVRRLPTCVVAVASVPGELEVELVPHIVHHSPTGMEFGYAGSGPADLALSLLTFHLQADPIDVKRLVAGEVSTELLKDSPALRVVRLYQFFKLEILAVTSLDFLDLSGKLLDLWIREREAKTVPAVGASDGPLGGNDES